MDIAEVHPEESARSWIRLHAKTKAEQAGDVEPWSTSQVRDFHKKLERTPSNHRELAELASCGSLISRMTWSMVTVASQAFCETLRKKLTCASILDENCVRKHSVGIPSHRKRNLLMPKGQT
jgi:hypothetical protein